MPSHETEEQVEEGEEFPPAEATFVALFAFSRWEDGRRKD